MVKSLNTSLFLFVVCAVFFSCEKVKIVEPDASSVRKIANPSGTSLYNLPQNGILLTLGRTSGYYVRAFDASNGSKIWEFYIAGSIVKKSFAIDGTQTVCFTAPAGTSDTLFALNLADGTVKWKFSEKYLSAPLTLGGVVYVYGSGYAYALNASDGSIIWQSDLGYINSANGPVFTTGSKLCIPFDIDGGGSSQMRLVALDMLTGAVKWQFDTDILTWGCSSPATWNGVIYWPVYAPINKQIGKMYAINASDGKQKFASDLEGNVFSDPTISNGSIFFSSNKFLKDAQIYDAATGAVKWTGSVNSSIYLLPPFLTNGMVYRTGLNGEILTAFDEFTNIERWKTMDFKDDSFYTGIPIVYNNTVYASGVNFLYAFNAFDGSLKWRVKNGNLFEGIINGIPIALVSNAGAVYPASSGKVQ